MWDPYAEFETVVLPNGLTIYVANWPGREWEHMGFLVHGGAKDDPEGLEGLAHFVEHLITKNAPVPYDDLKDYFKSFGGRVNTGGTSFYSTSYGFFIPQDRQVATRSLELFGEALLHSRLDQFIERERQVITSEFRRTFTLAHMFEMRQWEMQMVHHGTALENFTTPLGSIDTIARISQDDALNFYNTHYTPANISMVALGGFTASEVEDLVRSSPLASEKSGVRVGLPSPPQKLPSPLEKRYVLKLSEHVKHPVEHGEYRSVFRLPAWLPQYAVGMANDMIKEVLFEEVRSKRAWTYSIGSGWSYFGACCEFSIGITGLGCPALEGIEEVVEGSIAQLRSREDLFDKVRSNKIASYRMRDQSGGGVHSSAIHELGVRHRIVSYGEELRELESLSFSQVLETLEHFSPDRWWTRLIVP